MRSCLLLLLIVVSISGCSVLRPPPADPPAQELPAPETATPEVPPAPAPPVQTPMPARVPEPAATPPAPSTYNAPVAVVMSSRAAAYELVATALEELLPESEVYDLGDRSLSPRESFARIAASDARAIVAIGLRATLLAKEAAQVPVVFAQVFNVAENELTGETIRGVAVLPPLATQLMVWRRHEPHIESIGAIVGAGHEQLLQEAQNAASAAGLEFHYRVASSDRETLYHFNRLLPAIDAFWLFPDNRVLSASVLREMMQFAFMHDIAVAVFNETLLELGPALSTAADEMDIAYVVMRVLNRIDAGEINDVPLVSPLNEVRVTVPASVVDSSIATVSGSARDRDR